MWISILLHNEKLVKEMEKGETRLFLAMFKVNDNVTQNISVHSHEAATAFGYTVLPFLSMHNGY